jgi:hypothetical protein
MRNTLFIPILIQRVLVQQISININANSCCWTASFGIIHSQFIFYDIQISVLVLSNIYINVSHMHTFVTSCNWSVELVMD